MGNESRGEASLRQKLFKVVLNVSPGVVLGEDIEFASPSQQFILRDSEDATENQITAIMGSNSLDEAIELAESFADGFLSYLSYLSRTSVRRPNVVKGYEISPNTRAGEYVQFYYDWDIPSYSPRSVRKEDVDKVVLAFRNRSSDVVQRAKRAIHWYRDGVRSQNHLDKFISFSIALESLNPFLRDHYGLEVEYHICRNPECEQRSDFPTLNGMRTHIKNQYPDTNYWKRIRNVRNQITHGEVAFSEILEEAIQLLPIIEDCLVNALDLVFGVEGHEYKAGLSLSSERLSFGRIRTEVSGPDLAMLREREPDISVELIDLKRTRRDLVEFNISAVGRIASGYDIELKRIDRKQEEYLSEIDIKRMRLKIEHQE